MQLVQRTTWILCIVVAAVITTMAQSSSAFEVDGRWANGVSEAWWFEQAHPRNEVLVVQRKWADIETDAQASSDHRWQGDYFEGSDTHGDYLRWSSKGGFVWLKVDKCRATVMAFSYGSVVAGPTSIQFVPEKTISGTNHHKHTNFSSVRFLPVIWSKDLILVPQNEISGFGDYVAGLGRYNQWITFLDETMFFSRAVPNNSEFPTAEEPIVPPGYERFIKKPIELSVISIGKPYVRSTENEWWNEQITPVTLKLSRIGARPRLNFRIEESDEIIELTTVTGRSATGRIIRSVRKKPCLKVSDDDDCSEFEYGEIKVGMKASTRLVRL